MHPRREMHKSCRPDSQGGIKHYTLGQDYTDFVPSVTVKSTLLNFNVLALWISEKVH